MMESEILDIFPGKTTFMITLILFLRDNITFHFVISSLPPLASVRQLLTFAFLASIVT